MMDYPFLETCQPRLSMTATREVREDSLESLTVLLFLLRKPPTGAWPSSTCIASKSGNAQNFSRVAVMVMNEWRANCPLQFLNDRVEAQVVNERDAKPAKRRVTGANRRESRDTSRTDSC